MVETPIDQLTLRELFTTAERQLRELTEHLEQGYLPHVQQLRGMTRVEKSVQDFTSAHDARIRASAEKILAAEQFTHQLYRRLLEFLDAIDRSVTTITSES